MRHNGTIEHDGTVVSVERDRVRVDVEVGEALRSVRLAQTVRIGAGIAAPLDRDSGVGRVVVFGRRTGNRRCPPRARASEQ